MLLTFGGHDFSESADNERTEVTEVLSSTSAGVGGKVYLPRGKLSRIFCLVCFPRDNMWFETNIEQERGNWVFVLTPPLPKCLTFAVSESLVSSFVSGGIRYTIARMPPSSTVLRFSGSLPCVCVFFPKSFFSHSELNIH